MTAQLTSALYIHPRVSNHFALCAIAPDLHLSVSLASRAHSIRGAFGRAGPSPTVFSLGSLACQ